MAHPYNNFKWFNAGLLLVILFCGLALYHVPLQSSTFYFDDHSAIEYNQAIKTLDIPKIFSVFNTRFLVGLTFALNYRWGGLHPAGFRFINLLIHVLNAFLVYLLIKSTLYLNAARRPMTPARIKWAAVFGAMLFFCHPIQTEPVNFVTQRFVLMGTLFYLLTLFFYIQYRCRKKKRFMAVAVGAGIAAMFCKEFVVTLPFMLALYEFYFLGHTHAKARDRCRYLIPFFMIIVIVPILLLRTSPEAVGVASIADSEFIQKGNTSEVAHVDITRAYGGGGRKQYFLTELHVMCTYIRLLFLPVNQNFDYDYPLSRGMDNKTALCGVFLLCLLAFAAAAYRSHRIISFGIFWFFIALSVESSIIPIGHVIAEYRPYLASVGFVFVIMDLVYMRKGGLKRSNMAAAVILVVFSILTYQRNSIWRDEITLWSDSVHKSPHKARPYYNQGFAYFNQGRFIDAMPDFNAAIKLKPDYIEAYINRGISYYEKGNFAQSVSDYDKAIKINPNIGEAYYNRGLSFDKMGDYHQAVSDFTKAVEINPDYAEAYTNLGSIYVRQGNLNQALIDYDNAIRIYPSAGHPTNFNILIEGLKTAVGFLSKSRFLSYADAYYDRGCVYDKLGALTQALSDYTIAIEINSNYADAYNNRGYIYSRQENFTQAISDFTQAIEINPRIAGYYYNRGLAYGKQGHYDLAILDLTQAIAINPNYAGAYYDRSILYFESNEYDKARADLQRAEKLGAVAGPQFLNALNKALQ